MLERLLIAAALMLFGIAAWVIFNRLSIRRVAAQSTADPLLSDLRPNTPAIIYFTTPFCEPCRTLQRPALDKLQSELGKAIQVIQVDATQSPDVADRWGVFSAPTTFILDRSHKPQRVNRGVASTETLKQQLSII